MTVRKRKSPGAGATTAGRSPSFNRKSALIRCILTWYRKSARRLPWRRTRNPYRILVSEIMSQQTQVSRVLEKYPRFLKRFPNLQTLAAAKTSDVIRAWQGMGYNNRAIRLQRIAREVTANRGGNLPRDVRELQELPGIGKYTAHALSCFAFNAEVPVVDTNVRRVLTRLFPKLADRRDIWEVAALALPGRNAYDWNQALMDLGGTLCTASKPKCGECPARISCPSAFRAQRIRLDKQKSERERNGIPNRLYRGRIVETLRNLNGQRSISARALGKHIASDFRASDNGWLRKLLDSLRLDGLITVTRRKSELFISLPE